MAGRKSDFTLPTNTLDELFSTQEERDDAKLSKIRDIPLELIDDFPDHPFKVRDDEDMIQLVESVKERGVITPATVRQKEDGRYELISGHRRKRACELAGFEALRCEVVDLDRDAATVLMVESNYQRSQILPSEKAFAYKMRLDAMSRQGKRTDLTSDPVGPKLSGERSNIELSSETGDSTSQIKRYIRLTNLVPELLDLVDEGKIKMRPAVELSYLDEDNQRAVVDRPNRSDEIQRPLYEMQVLGRVDRRAWGSVCDRNADLQFNGRALHHSAVLAVQHPCSEQLAALRCLGFHFRRNHYGSRTNTRGLYFNRTIKLTVLN